MKTSACKSSTLELWFSYNQKLKEINRPSAKPFRIRAKRCFRAALGTTCFRRTLPQRVFAMSHDLSFRGCRCSLCATYKPVHLQTFRGTFGKDIASANPSASFRAHSPKLISRYPRRIISMFSTHTSSQEKTAAHLSSLSICKISHDKATGPCHGCENSGLAVPRSSFGFRKSCGGWALNGSA